MKVAIVHDWFVGGGAERVAYELHKLYPEAPVYTAYCSPHWRQKLGSAQIRTSYMQRWPFPKLRKFLPVLRGIWFSHLKLHRRIITGAGTTNICGTRDSAFLIRWRA
jgi:hypothetical protein